MVFPHAARFGDCAAGAALVLQNDSPRNFSAGDCWFVPPSVTRICAVLAGRVKISVSVLTSPSGSFWPRTLARGIFLLSGDQTPIVKNFVSRFVAMAQIGRASCRERV